MGKYTIAALGTREDRPSLRLFRLHPQLRAFRYGRAGKFTFAHFYFIGIALRGSLR